MKIADLQGKKVLIWGVGREALAAAALIRQHLPDLPLLFVDENSQSSPDACAAFGPLVTEPEDMARELNHADVIIKSPGVSLYHPMIEQARAQGKDVTSLINLWFSIPHRGKTVCVTGTKGKSTVASLIAHMLTGLGKKTALLGNIGHAVGSIPADDADYIVIEMSSYQTANFNGLCDVAVMTSLYPEHLDWHRTLEAYYRDKLNLLAHAKKSFAHQQCREFVREGVTFTNGSDGFHARDGALFYRAQPLPLIHNRYLLRAHNLENICLALSVVEGLGFDPAAAMATLDTFKGLPHRQNELGIRDSILYVDDSISTTPQSALAALNHYRAKPVTLIAGGHDRGIDYTPLIDALSSAADVTVICMGNSGQKIFYSLRTAQKQNVYMADGMDAAVAQARQHTLPGGVILLSPAAPSYGMFRDFVDRGQAFARAAGFI